MSEFFPEFTNPIVLDDILSDSSTFKPAKTVVTVKHLLNYSSGLYYPVYEDVATRMPNAYAAAHDMQDPYSTFFKIVKVNRLFSCCQSDEVLMTFMKGDLPGIPLKFEPGTDCKYITWNLYLVLILEPPKSPTDIALMYSGSLSKRSLEKPWNNTCMLSSPLREFIFPRYSTHESQEHIFKPLGIKGSFYLTPELEKNILTLTYGRNGVLEPWNYQPETTVIERDPTKSEEIFQLAATGINSR